MKIINMYKMLCWVNPKSGFDVSSANDNRDKLVKELLEDDNRQSTLEFFLESESKHEGMVARAFFSKTEISFNFIKKQFPEADFIMQRNLNEEVL